MIKKFLKLNVLRKVKLYFTLFFVIHNFICQFQNNLIFASKKIYLLDENNTKKESKKLNRLMFSCYYKDHKIYKKKEILDFEKKLLLNFQN